MVLYGITIIPLDEELGAANSGVLSLFYADDSAFNGFARQSAQLLKLWMERGPYQGYFPEPENSLFISDTQGQEEGMRREFATEGL